MSCAPGDQRRDAQVVVALARQQDKAGQITESIDQATILIVRPPRDRSMV